MSGLPQQFGSILLTFSLVLLVSPYLSGTDFGVFKVPQLSLAVRGTLVIVGPALFVAILLLFIPVWKSSQVGGSTLHLLAQIPKTSGALVAASLASTDTPEPTITRHQVPGGLCVDIRTPDAVLADRSNLLEGWACPSAIEPDFLLDCALVLAELTLNAFEHGHASFVQLTLYQRYLVIEDDGVSFDPLEQERTAPPAGGAGMFALNHFLTRRAVKAQHRTFPKATAPLAFRAFPLGFYPETPPISNQFILYLTGIDQHAEGAQFEIRLRPTSDRVIFRPWDIPHRCELGWGYQHYLLNLPQFIEQAHRPRVLSLEGDVVVMIFAILPQESVLHLIVEDHPMTRDRYRSLAQTLFQGRLILE